jgi:phenylalanyl-tRNA synthetase beta chain
MRVPLSWLRTHVELPSVQASELAGRLTDVGLKVEHIDRTGEDINGVVVARVVDIEDVAGQKKPIRWVTLDDGGDRRQVICGATNFGVGDLIAYARPPASLPGGFTITKKRAYGHDSDGMICSARELGVGDDHTGILVLGGGLPLGADVVETLGLRDVVLDIAVNPDRGYALSVRGVAREVAIAYGLDYDDPGAATVPASTAAGWDVRIDDPSGCDRYVARLITGLDPSVPSPQWLQRRLTLAGMRPISLAVDVTNHVMLDLGQPLHAFDRNRLRGAIVVRRARPGERIRTLDDVDRALHDADLVITDDSGPIAIAGVMGGASTEIDAATTDIVLESAHFDPASVAYTARRHRLPSEASRRFERGVDDALPAVAAHAAADLLSRLGAAGTEVACTDVDRRAPRPSITLDAGLPSRLSGVEYTAATVRARLTDIGAVLTGDGVTGDGQLRVQPPSWRPDLRLDVDLVEEVVRLEGYDRLPVTVPAAPAGRGLTRRQRLRRTASRSLAAAGYVEVVTYPFVPDRITAELMLGEDDDRRPSVRIANPVSDEEPFLRPTLLPGILAALARNTGRGFADLALYETGPVFRAGAATDPVRLTAGTPPTPDQLARLERTLPFQPTHLAAALTGARERAGWWGPGRAATWADAVESAHTVAAALGVALDVRSDVHAPWHPGRCAALEIAGTLVGHAGELHPRVIDRLDLPPRTAAMELRLDVLLDAAPEELTAAVISPFPAAVFDLALVVDAGVAAADVSAALRHGAGPLLEDLRLFDVYTGSQVGEGRKSLAFAVRLRAPDRTLTAEESAAVRNAAVDEAARRCGASLRGR